MTLIGVYTGRNPEAYMQAKRMRVLSFRRTEQGARLRAQLLLTNPHCDNCGKALQGIDRDADDYANVVRAANRLSCRACVPIVAALAAVE